MDVYLTNYKSLITRYKLQINKVAKSLRIFSRYKYYSKNNYSTRFM